MASVFRVCARGGAPIGDTDTLDGVIELASNAPAGRYRIEKITFDPATGESRTWKWGMIVKHLDGAIKLILPPWID